MKYIPLGRTGLTVSRTSFGALPMQRVDFDTAAELLRYAYDHGVTFFDTARAYSDSEEKIAYALGDVRGKIILATKSMSSDLETLKRNLDTSLNSLKTDYIDLFQFHNPAVLPSEDMLAYARDLKSQGVLRHIGITSHSHQRATEYLETGLFETLQFPLSCLADEAELALVKVCAAKGIGFIAMKAMAGGLITRVRENAAYLRSLETVVPIWGIQRLSEIQEFVAYEEEDAVFDESMKQACQEEREALGGSFCRGCGYCKPCPAGIPLETACRIDMLLSRVVYQSFITPEFQAQMTKVEQCTGCGACNARCPYHLGPQALVKRQYEGYKEFLRGLRPPL